MQANVYPAQQGVKYSPQAKSGTIIIDTEHQRVQDARKKQRNIIIGLYVLCFVCLFVVLPLVGGLTAFFVLRSYD